jgi:hypothetical protein
MNDLLQSLQQERFGISQWWVTPRPEFVDSKLMQGIRRRALSEALEGIDEEEEAI